MKRKLFKNSILLLVAIIWGAAFIAQSKGLEVMSTYWLNGIRMLMAAIVLFPLAKFIDHKANYNSIEERNKNAHKSFFVGLACGVVLFLASSFQCFGIVGAGAGKSAFITTLYIVIVPLLSIFLHEKIGINAIISVPFAVIGMFFLCTKGTFSSLSIYDLYLIICAFFFSIQILIISKFSKNANGVKISFYQALVVGILSCIVGAFTDKLTANALIQALPALLYLGLMSSGVGYTLQIIGQTDNNPTIASLIMALESVFSLWLGVIILHESFETIELIGCAFIFASIIISQISFSKKSTI